MAPSGRVVVTITAANYGQAGGVTETLPAGFAYVSSSLSLQPGQPKRPECPVHPPGGGLLYLHRHRIRDAGDLYLLRHAEGRRRRGTTPSAGAGA